MISKRRCTKVDITDEDLKATETACLHDLFIYLSIFTKEFDFFKLLFGNWRDVNNLEVRFVLLSSKCSCTRSDLAVMAVHKGFHLNNLIT